jgi:L-lactate dehydrogenase complex protein LldG
MQESTTREKVLKKIRKALIHKTGNPYPQADFDSKIYQHADESKEIVFAGKLMESGGHFIFCDDRFDFAEQLTTLGAEKKWKNIVCPDPKLGSFLQECEYPFVKNLNDLKKTDAAITFCECLVARTGSILLSSRQEHGRRIPGIANALLVLAFADQLADDIKDALQLMKSRYSGRLPSMLTFITGPSKTADIDLIPVTGAHGPAELFVFLIDDSTGF